MMQKASFVLLAATLMLAAGCNKELKQTTEKIAEQTLKLTALQEIQARQISMLQTQIVALGPMLDEMNSIRYQKSYADALFFHTNTLYLLLAVDRQIESELRSVEARQQAQRELVFSYHTNLLTILQSTDTGIREALLAHQSRLETNLLALGSLMTQQLEALKPTQNEIAQRQRLLAEVEQIKNEIAQVRSRLSATNALVSKP